MKLFEIKTTTPDAETSISGKGSIWDAYKTTAKDFDEACSSGITWIIKNREKLLEAFIAETGLMPSECELIEQQITDSNSITTRVYFRKRVKEEETKSEINNKTLLKIFNVIKDEDLKGISFMLDPISKDLVVCFTKQEGEKLKRASHTLNYNQIKQGNLFDDIMNLLSYRIKREPKR